MEALGYNLLAHKTMLHLHNLASLASLNTNERTS